MTDCAGSRAGAGDGGRSGQRCRARFWRPCSKAGSRGQGPGPLAVTPPRGRLRLVRTGARRLFRLHLHRSAEASGRARCNHQVAALDFLFAAHDLTNRSDRVHDCGAGWIGHETLQRLQSAAA
jgi:hypothetical protein